MAQIRPIVSESLEAQIRDLLPSQNGFTEDLQAQNVIVPVIDLTSAAEGSALPIDLSRALAFGSQTSIVANGSTVTIANTAGFWRIFGYASVYTYSGTATVDFDMSDGVSTKEIFSVAQSYGSVASNQTLIVPVDLNVFLDTGESISVTASSRSEFSGSVRQIATVNGTLVNPSGFSAQ